MTHLPFKQKHLSCPARLGPFAFLCNLPSGAIFGVSWPHLELVDISVVLEGSL